MGIDLVQEPDIPKEPPNREGENFLPGRNNQLIIFKRDRPQDVDSGYGDDAKTGTIHIVVGRNTQETSFQDDSAFIYTTMKTDVDKNLGVDGMTDGDGNSIPAQIGSAAIIKADNVRLVHRATGDIRITSDDGSNFINLTSNRIEIKFAGSWLKLEDGTITVESGNIKLGKNASAQSVILGDMFINEFLQHVHQSPTGPTSIPLPLGITQTQSGGVLSKKSLVE